MDRSFDLPVLSKKATVSGGVLGGAANPLVAGRQDTFLYPNSPIVETPGRKGSINFLNCVITPSCDSIIRDPSPNTGLRFNWVSFSLGPV